MASHSCFFYNDTFAHNLQERLTGRLARLLFTGLSLPRFGQLSQLLAQVHRITHARQAYIRVYIKHALEQATTRVRKNTK